MKKQMVGAMLTPELVRELELMGDVEQCDRSTIMHELLSQSIQQGKLDHYIQLYRDRKFKLARVARDAGMSMREMMFYAHSRWVPAECDTEDLERDPGTIHGSLGVSTVEHKAATGAQYRQTISGRGLASES